MQTKRARPGDVLEVATPNGFIYLHYLGKHPEYGDAVLISPGKQERPVDDLDHLFDAGYTVFYPVGAAVAQKMVKIVGHLDSPGVPKRLRRPAARVGKTIETWVIEDDSGEVVIRELSSEERKLPIATIWNHEFLIQRVSEGWRPEGKSDHE